MLEEFDTKEKVRDLFAGAKLPHGSDQYMIAYSTWPTGAMILGGAGTAMTSNVDSAYGGYLVQICENGLNLIPLAKKTQKNTVISASKLHLCSGKPFHLDIKKMRSFKNHPANGISPFARTITIEMDSGKKYVWLVNRKERNLPYHEEGLAAISELKKSL